MKGRSSFFTELKRRNVVRAGLLYIGVVWALSQGLAQLLPVFDVPNWVVRGFVIAGVIGFPFWLLFAWFYELTPDGLKRESDVVVDASITRRTGRKLDVAIVAVLAVAVVLLLTDKFFVRSENGIVSIVAKSIAVLPFTDLSPAHDQAYFSDGMAEEILNALAQVHDLKVAARTSSFYFKDKNEDLRVIGKALSVANVLEGSVRKQGDQVRITAQLIQASDGYNLWSESYDGDLKDVFGLQERIARAITDRLKITLVGEQKTQLVAVATADTAAYALYLQAREAYRARGPNVQRSVDLYRAALQRDPKFALAWAGLCGSLNVLPYYLPKGEMSRLPEIYRDAETAGKRSIELAPDLATPHIMLGNLYANAWKWRDAQHEFERAQALAPPDADFYFAYTDWLGAVGRSKEALEAARRAVELDPLAPAPRNLYGYLLSYWGRFGESVSQLEAGHTLAPHLGFINTNLFISNVLAGRIDDAQKQAAEMSAAQQAGEAVSGDVADADRVFGAMLAVARDPSRYDTVRHTLADDELMISFIPPMHIDDLLTFIEANFIDRPGSGTDGPVILRSPLLDGHRNDPHYVRLLHKLGFDDKGDAP